METVAVGKPATVMAVVANPATVIATEMATVAVENPATVIAVVANPAPVIATEIAAVAVGNPATVIAVVANPATVIATVTAPTAAVEVVFFLTQMPETSRLKHQGGRRYSLDSGTCVNIRLTQNWMDI